MAAITMMIQTMITLLLFNIISTTSADNPTLLVIERDHLTNYSLIVQYSWNNQTFKRILLSTVTNYITSASFSPKRQTLFLLYENVADHRQFVATYDVQKSLLTRHVVIPYTYTTICCAVYLDSTDELWVLYLQDDRIMLVSRLVNFVDGSCDMDYQFPIIQAPNPLDYAFSDHKVYFGGETNSGQLWTLFLDTHQLLIEPLSLGRGYLAIDADNSLLFYTGWEKYHSTLASIDLTTKHVNNYFEQFPQNTEISGGCMASVIDGNYISSMNMINPAQRVLAIAIPGGSTFIQPIDNDAAWVWKWPESKS